MATALTQINGYAHVAERYGFEEAVFLHSLMFWYRTGMTAIFTMAAGGRITASKRLKKCSPGGMAGRFAALLFAAGRKVRCWTETIARTAGTERLGTVQATNCWSFTVISKPQIAFAENDKCNCRNCQAHLTKTANVI